jgi:hypothetical protein
MIPPPRLPTIAHAAARVQPPRGVTPLPQGKLQHFPQHGYACGHAYHGPAHPDIPWLPPLEWGGDEDHEPRPWQVEENADPEAQVQPRQHHCGHIDHRWPLSDVCDARERSLRGEGSAHVIVDFNGLR